jgi:hypothetical protein|tara:strand:+ start:669 stop:908 length:240 start_codon:yes stop_codon:yes gene_type:complete
VFYQRIVPSVPENKRGDENYEYKKKNFGDSIERLAGVDKFLDHLLIVYIFFLAYINGEESTHQWFRTYFYNQKMGRSCG